jgi:hypothetical protein
MNNDGQATLNNIKAMGLDTETKLSLIRKIRELPRYAEYKSEENGLKFILCHAGYTPGEYFDSLWDDQKEQKMLWDRNHFNFPWPLDEKYDNVVMIHGHTPILLLNQMGYTKETGMRPMWYECNHKVNLDAATANTGLALLFNLDTLDYELFTANPDYIITNKNKRR